MKRLRRSAQDPSPVVPATVLGIIIIAGVFADKLSINDVEFCTLHRSLQAPSWAHILGTDFQGCDYFARLLHGARNSLAVAGGVTLGSMTIATGLGTWAGWSGGWVDAIISRITDTLFAVPVILTALLIFGLTEKRTLGQVVLVLTLFSWPPMVRVVRASVIERLSYEYVDASRALGAGPLHIIRRHILPDVVGPLLSFSLPYAGSIIALEAVLSYVGAGLQLPNVSWGLMLSGLGAGSGAGPRLSKAPHLLAPVLALTVLIWSLISLGSWVSQRNPARHG